MKMTDRGLERLNTLLQVMAGDAGADRAALFVPEAADLRLVADCDLCEADLDIVQAGWQRYRADLSAGRVVRIGQAVLWAVFQGPRLAAVVYLDQAADSFPNDSQQGDGARLAARLDHLEFPPPGSYLLSPAPATRVTRTIVADGLGPSPELAILRREAPTWNWSAPQRESGDN